MDKQLILVINRNMVFELLLKKSYLSSYYKRVILSLKGLCHAKLCNFMTPNHDCHLKPLNNKFKKKYNKRKEEHGWTTQMEKIESDCIGVILKKVGPMFFKVMANRLHEGRFCSCNTNFILKGILYYI